MVLTFSEDSYRRCIGLGSQCRMRVSLCALQRGARRQFV